MARDLPLTIAPYFRAFQGRQRGDSSGKLPVVFRAHFLLPTKVTATLSPGLATSPAFSQL